MSLFCQLPKKLGHFVGIAESVGDAMTYKVLTDDTKKVIYHSSVRSALIGSSLPYLMFYLMIFLDALFCFLLMMMVNAFELLLSKRSLTMIKMLMASLPRSSSWSMLERIVQKKFMLIPILLTSLTKRYWKRKQGSNFSGSRTS